MSVETINQKKAVVEEISEKFKKASSAIIVEYRGLDVAEVTELRNELRDEDVEFKVYKNRLAQRATEGTDYSSFNDSLKGPNAIAFGGEDAVAPARVLAKFAKDHDALVIKAAVVEGKVLSIDEVKELATLPNREGMYSMLLSTLQAPVSQFARVVKAVADSRPEDGSAEEAAPVEEAKEEPKTEEVKEAEAPATAEATEEKAEEPAKEENKEAE
ncbi:MAG: 50S ribosomal protein L10 [Thomasclavelia sp.]|jgi:large subunit ribosomal protein L10|nr:50S ribosomal protein L10 [Thomasclavelia sp.]